MISYLELRLPRPFPVAPLEFKLSRLHCIHFFRTNILYFSAGTSHKSRQEDDAARDLRQAEGNVRVLPHDGEWRVAECDPTQPQCERVLHQGRESRHWERVSDEMNNRFSSFRLKMLSEWNSFKLAGVRTKHISFNVDKHLNWHQDYFEMSRNSIWKGWNQEETTAAFLIAFSISLLI